MKHILNHLYVGIWVSVWHFLLSQLKNDMTAENLSTNIIAFNPTAKMTVDFHVNHYVLRNYKKRKIRILLAVGVTYFFNLIEIISKTENRTKEGSWVSETIINIYHYYWNVLEFNLEFQNFRTRILMHFQNRTKWATSYKMRVHIISNPTLKKSSTGKYEN